MELECSSSSEIKSSLSGGNGSAIGKMQMPGLKESENAEDKECLVRQWNDLKN